MLGKFVVLCKNDLANTIVEWKKHKPIDTFVYQHFKLTGHSPNDVLVQPVEKLIKILLRDSKSSKDMKRN